MQNRTLVVAREEQRRGCSTPRSTELSAPAQRFVEMDEDRSLPKLGGLQEDELVKDRRLKGGREEVVPSVVDFGE
jgi:hypothetical protein